MTSDWNRHPPIELPSPALAVLSGPNGVWAGGLGGVAWHAEDDGWTPLVSGLPLRSVTALAFGAGSLLAGGDGGIARSGDRGRSWQPCTVPDGTGTVTAIALSPNFPQDGTALAATLDNGILRSTDAGQSWLTSSFGLQTREVLAVTWGAGEAVVAATASGLHRSPNGGRAWRVYPRTEEISFSAVATLPDGAVLAAPDIGPPLRSAGDDTTWSPVGGLPDDIRTWALLPLPGGRVLLSSENHGVLLSTDGGSTWSTVWAERALSLTADDGHVYAGTNTGVSLSKDAGRTWTTLPPTPLHDLRRLLVVDGGVLIAGTNSPPVMSRPDGGWTVLASTPLPLMGLFVAPDGALVGSTPDGLFRSRDRGASWEPVIAGREGCVTRMTFLPDGTGWAGVTPDSAVLRTPDGGRTWDRLRSLFGVLPLVALQAIPASTGRRTASLVAATYDDRQRAVCIWRSDDGGERWVRGADTYTPWPVVATCGTPPVVTIDNVITVQQSDGTWRQVAVGKTGVRRVVTDGTTLVALAGDGLWRSADLGATWTRNDAGLPVDQIADVALDGGLLYALLAGGQLWSRSLDT